VDRAKYNACIGQSLAGKKMTRAQRKLEFCISAKLCSGKVKSRPEAERICMAPKTTKVGKGEVKEPELSCTARNERAFSNMDTIIAKMKVGETEGLDATVKSILTDIQHCRAPEIQALAADALGKVHEIAKSQRFYLKGEFKEIAKELGLLRAALQGESTSQ